MILHTAYRRAEDAALWHRQLQKDTTTTHTHTEKDIRIRIRFVFEIFIFIFIRFLFCDFQCEFSNGFSFEVSCIAFFFFD